nr:hypothetical protein [Micromonospora sp. DSM 115978]
MPSTAGPVHPDVVASSLAEGRSRASDVVEQLVEATAAGMRTVADLAITPVVAHLFSLLPKVGLADGDVPDDLLDGLAAVAAETGAVLDDNEKWACPSPRVVARFLAAGACVAPGSDSHVAADVGRCPTSQRT